MCAITTIRPLSFVQEKTLYGVAFITAWLALYLPAYISFAEGAWRRGENAHALVIMAIAGCIAGYRLFVHQPDFTQSFIVSAAGLSVCAFVIALIIVGTRSETDLFVSASQSFVALGAILFLFGVSGVRLLWFPLFLTLYLIIWPGWALDALTGPLKMFVSGAVSDLLYAAGLPVAHSGAVITAGPYRLLVANACAGLNSLISLTSVGAVYLFAIGARDWRVNAAVIALLVPIAIAANILRVAILVLITFFLGYDAGQGFLHEGAGLVMFAAALGAVFLVDALAVRLTRPAGTAGVR